MSHPLLARRALESGRALLAGDRGQSRRYLLAALTLAGHFAGGGDDYSHLDFVQRLHATALVGALLRRSLPLQAPDLRELVTWVLGKAPVEFSAGPNAFVVRALERWSATNDLDQELLQVVQSYSSRLRRSNGTQPRRLAAQLDRVVQAGSAPVVVPRQTAPVPKPAPAGNALVLLALKRALGVAASFEAEPATTVTGPDQFAMPVESPLRAEHDLISAIFDKAVQGGRYAAPDARRLKAVGEMDPAARGRLLLAAAERRFAALSTGISLDDDVRSLAHYAADEFATSWPQSRLEFERQGLFDTLIYWSTLSPLAAPSGEALAMLLRGMEPEIESGAGLTEGERYVLHLWRASLITAAPMGTATPEIDKLTQWIGDSSRFFLVPGERWSDAVNEEISNLPPQEGQRWAGLLGHLLTAQSARPTEKWRKEAKRLIDSIGCAAIRQALERWLPLVSKGRSLPTFPAYAGDTRHGGDLIHESNATLLRGLLWTVPMLDGREALIRLITSVALSAYRKIPGVGPRAVKVGNAAVFALSEIGTADAVAQLAMIKVRVRFGTAQKEVEKAFDAAARVLDLPRDEIEELNVPVCGLESVGRRVETIGGYRAELIVTGSEVSLNWYDSRGKKLTSAPAAAKRGENAEAWKELRAAHDDLNAMIGVQRDRMDAMFLERKSWPAGVWRERYLDHPLMGTIARRLIWCAGESTFTAVNGETRDLLGAAVTIALDAPVSLWHPAGRDAGEVQAWRRRIEELEIVQPFKQAHREVYLLTDAERRTNTYSNRFAAHVLRQHQFNALCGARRWKNRLRMMVDDTYPPASRDLPAWGLRAEFWIEGAGGDFGIDTNDSGAFLRLTSDQVRFYRVGAAVNRAHAGGGGYETMAAGPGMGDINAPLALETIPALVFSEIMRDVDLFVGVASIGNDPTWQDGGPDGRYRLYWTNYSFGELGATAVSRRDALERLLPRLKIASVCKIDGRFLIVRGKKRTYKIHLGSGNILMEPNDQYLCIVPDSRSSKQVPGLYLPFEGDRVLSIILSKAFLLAADDEIQDRSILSQIG